MTYALGILVIWLIYASVAAGLNVMVGQARQASLLSAAFMSMGGYAFAGFSLGDPRLVLVCCIGFVLLVLLAAAAFTLLEDDLFILVTLTLQGLTMEVLLNWRSLGGGPLGLVLGELPTPNSAVLAALTIALLTLVAATRLRRRSTAMAIAAIGTSPRWAASHGRPVPLLKGAIIAVHAVAGALGGALLTWCLSYAHPTMFSLDVSLMLLGAIILGGTRPWSPFLGAAIFVGVPELLRFLSVSGQIDGSLRYLLFNTLLLVSLLIGARPRPVQLP